MLLHSQGYSCSDIVQHLSREFSICVSHQTVSRFLLIYIRSSSLTRKIDLGGLVRLHPIFCKSWNKNADDETTAVQLMDLLKQSEVYTLYISLSSLKRCRLSLGWIFHGTRYCQLILEPNKLKRLEFASKCLAENETFDDVIWTDETSVQLECHRGHCFRKQ